MNNSDFDSNVFFHPPWEPGARLMSAIDVLSLGLPVFAAVLAVAGGVAALKGIDSAAAILGIAGGIVSAAGLPAWHRGYGTGDWQLPTPRAILAFKWRSGRNVGRWTHWDNAMVGRYGGGNDHWYCRLRQRLHRQFKKRIVMGTSGMEAHEVLRVAHLGSIQHAPNSCSSAWMMLSLTCGSSAAHTSFISRQSAFMFYPLNCRLGAIYTRALNRRLSRRPLSPWMVPGLTMRR